MSKEPTTPMWPWNNTTTQDVSLLIVGDTNLQNRRDPAEAFAHVHATLQEADVLFGQLEGPLLPPSTDPLRPDIPHKSGWCHSDPAMVQGLVAVGFAAVSCASNVTYGSSAILNSLSTLDHAGIKHCGAGRNLVEARQPAIIERRGVRLGFLSYTSVFWPVGHAATADAPGVATIKATTAYQPHQRVLEMPGAPATVVTTPDPEELASMEADVRQLRSEVDLIVVSCHWGVSGSSVVTDYQQVIGRTAISSGADVVFGHHPHVVQGVEIWENRPIFYSLGNFTFDWVKMQGRQLDGLLVRCLIREGQLNRVSFVPVRRGTDNLVRLLDPSGAGSQIAERVRELSQVYGTSFSIDGSEVVVDGIERR